MKRIIIVGGGVAVDCGAACKISRARTEGHEVEFVLIEKDPRVGGKILTEIVHAPRMKVPLSWMVVRTAFLTEKPACHRIAS